MEVALLLTAFVVECEDLRGEVGWFAGLTSNGWLAGLTSYGWLAGLTSHGWLAGLTSHGRDSVLSTEALRVDDRENSAVMRLFPICKTCL